MATTDQHPPDGLECLAWASLAPIHGDLAERCRTDLDQLARALRVLERDGYVECAIAESNGRSMHRVMTPGARPRAVDWVPMPVKLSDIPQAWTWPLSTDPTRISNANTPTLFESL